MVCMDSESHLSSSLMTHDSDLAVACDRWSATGIIGIDTEFVRERTYHPRPALVQVADGDDVAMVDPLRISDFGPLDRLLADSSVVKVMHACDEDLEVLALLTGGTTRGVFDTQLAGAFAGYGFSLGYRSLVEALLDVALDKGETRSDWLRRPLSPAQLRYAALDVVYLSAMHERLSHELTALGRISWFEEELEHRRRARAADAHPSAAYLRVRKRGTLSPAHHAVLRALSQWREVEARVRDIPRRHLLTDEVLIALASDPALDEDSLENIQGLSRRAGARYGQTILACINEAQTEGHSEIDAPVNLRPYADTMDRLKEIARTEAAARGLPAALLANRRALETLLVSVVTNGADIPDEFQGWRFDVITKTLLDCIHDVN